MLNLKVSDMSCGHCAASVRKAVAGVDPAAEVVVDLAAGTVQVKSDADAARIAGAIRDAGYPAEPIAA